MITLPGGIGLNSVSKVISSAPTFNKQNKKFISCATGDRETKCPRATCQSLTEINIRYSSQKKKTYLKVPTF